MTGALPTVAVLPLGLATLMNTAVLATLPDAAVTLPETVNMPAPVTVVGETATVTTSEAAVAASGVMKSNARSSDAQKTVLMALIIVTTRECRYI
ncbi:MAG: hypothetical protein LYZ69_05070 [Nitrososphaerales archaeon]|nr:hypothetical protein [Nitrososphaerales archaeon]